MNDPWELKMIAQTLNERPFRHIARTMVERINFRLAMASIPFSLFDHGGFWDVGQIHRESIQSLPSDLKGE